MKRLVLNFARIGDLVMTEPVLRHLGRDAEVHFLCRPFGRELFRGQSVLAQVHGLKHPNQGNRLFSWFLESERGKTEKELATIGFDEVYLFSKERTSINRWIAQVLPKARLLVFSGTREPAPGMTSCHYTELNRRHLASVGISVQDFEPFPRLSVNAQSAARAEQWFSPFGTKIVGLQIGTQRTDRMRWWRRSLPNLKSPPLSLWREIIEYLVQDQSLDSILLHGSENEGPVVRSVLTTLSPKTQKRVHVVAGTLPLDLLPAVLARHSGFISADTGPAHIAAAVSCPLVVFFGPSDRNFYRMPGPGPVEILGDQPACSPCLGVTGYESCTNNLCLNQVKIESVVSAWEKVQKH